MHPAIQIIFILAFLWATLLLYFTLKILSNIRDTLSTINDNIVNIAKEFYRRSDTQCS